MDGQFRVSHYGLFLRFGIVLLLHSMTFGGFRGNFVNSFFQRRGTKIFSLILFQCAPTRYRSSLRKMKQLRTLILLEHCSTGRSITIKIRIKSQFIAIGSHNIGIHVQ
jgi:hypothetical protein